MIMALGAKVDVRIIFVREHIGRGQKEIIRRGQRLPELIGVSETRHHVGPDARLMRIMADNTGDADIRIVGQRGGDDVGRRAAQHRESNRARMTTSAGVDAVGRTHVSRNREVPAGFPFVVSRMVRPVVTTAAHLSGDLLARTFCQIHFVRRVRGSRAVATFALHPSQSGICVHVILADKSGWQTKSDRVAGQARGVRLTALTGEQSVGERSRVARIGFVVVNTFVTFSACLRPGKLRGRPSDFEECVAVKIGDRGDAFQTGRTAGLPCRITQT